MPLAQTIGLETLSKYFHLPINDVAKELGVCATVLKKICRKNGIPRWPHRKVYYLTTFISHVYLFGILVSESRSVIFVFMYSSMLDCIMLGGYFILTLHVMLVFVMC
jgi:hypothetical protein